MQDLATFLPRHMACSARNGLEPSILAAQHQELKGRDSGTLTCRRAPKRSEADWIKCAEICTPLALAQHLSAKNHANHLKNNSNEGTKTSLQIWPPDCSHPLCSLNLSFFGALMAWMRRVFGVPASETQTGLTLALCIFSMSLMAVALIWQAQVIAKQNAVIHMMQSRFGG